MDKKFLKKLEKMRNQMVQTGMKYGFQNKKTILISQQLDEIINEYYAQINFQK